MEAGMLIGATSSIRCICCCAWKVTTVSPSYMEELEVQFMGLVLFHQENHKCVSILNGIDNEVWDPATDPFFDFCFMKAM